MLGFVLDMDREHLRVARLAQEQRDVSFGIQLGHRISTPALMPLLRAIKVEP
jgi:hypothetical protein